VQENNHAVAVTNNRAEVPVLFVVVIADEQIAILYIGDEGGRAQLCSMFCVLLRIKCIQVCSKQHCAIAGLF